jgi:hypothetical protein
MNWRWTFRERTLNPWQWFLHSLLSLSPRPTFVRKDGRIHGMLVPRPIKHFGRLWAEWRLVSWR